MRKRDLFLGCLRPAVEAYRHGTFNRWEAVACMATCIDIHMRTDPADAKTSPEIRDAGAVPILELREPLSADDQVLQELYAEATTFWAEGYGRLRLVK
jgi:hypothetical protein